MLVPLETLSRTQKCPLGEIINQSRTPCCWQPVAAIGFLLIMLAKSFFYASIFTKSIDQKGEIILPFMLAFFETLCSIFARHVNLMFDYASYNLSSNTDATLQPIHEHTDA